MKLVPALVITALLGSSAAFAADTPDAAPAPAAKTTKHSSLKACNKQADAKKLAGEERTAFVKDCHGTKSKKG